MSSSAVVAPFTLQTIEEGVFKGKQFRHTNDVPRKTAVIDWIMAITSCNLNAANQMMYRIKRANPEVVTVLYELQFEGQGQRPTPCTNAKGLLFILDKLPRKYVAKFQAERDTLLARYLGGDTSLAEEVQAIRQAQQQLPAEHPMRVFGEAVETGEVGKLVDEEKVEHHMLRGDIREGNKKAAAVVHDSLKPNVPDRKGQREFHARFNAEKSRAVMGQTPAKWKAAHGLPKNATTRDFCTRQQLMLLSTIEKAAATVMANAQTEFADQVSKMKSITDKMFEICELAGHHKEFNPKGLPVLNAAEHKTLEDQGGQNQLLLKSGPLKRKQLEAIEAEEPPEKKQQFLEKRITNTTKTIEEYFSKA